MSKDKVWPFSELTGEQRPFAGGNLDTYDINETLAEYILSSLLKYLMRLKTGDRVYVDGGKGVIEIMEI